MKKPFALSHSAESKRIGRFGQNSSLPEQARRKGFFKDILKGKVTVPTDDKMNESNLSVDNVKKMKRI